MQCQDPRSSECSRRRAAKLSMFIPTSCQASAYRTSQVRESRVHGVGCFSLKDSHWDPAQHYSKQGSRNQAQCGPYLRVGGVWVGVGWSSLNRGPRTNPKHSSNHGSCSGARWDPRSCAERLSTKSPTSPGPLLELCWRKSMSGTSQLRQAPYRDSPSQALIKSP